MFELYIDYDLNAMKAIARCTLYTSAAVFMALGGGVLAAALCAGGIAGCCLGLTGGFLLLYPPFLCARFPVKMLREHTKIAPKAKYTFDAEKIMCVSGAAIWVWSWDEVRRIVWTHDHVLILCRGDEAIALPKAALSACEGLEAFLRRRSVR